MGIDKNYFYRMDGKPDKWKIVYYPLFQDGKTQEYYDEPRALVQNVEKEGFWHKETPIRYLEKGGLIGNCDCCKKEIEIFMCCSAQECGCLGLPTEPPVCSEKCETEYINKIKNADRTKII